MELRGAQEILRLIECELTIRSAEGQLPGPRLGGEKPTHQPLGGLTGEKQR